MKKFLIMLVLLLGSYSVSYAETYEVTAYTHTGSVMANGEYPHVGAVASNDFQLGTVLNINGSNYVVKDRMAYNGVIDIFVDSYDEAINFGRKYLNVYVVG